MKRILLIEDEADFQELYREILSPSFEVDVAHDGEEGLAKITGGEYALVLLDVMLPKIDGLALLKEARKTEKGKRAKVALLTNYRSEEIWKQFRELGVADILVKSDLLPDQFLQRVEKAQGSELERL